MPTHIALLRGINVGGKTMIPMAGLKTLFAKQGLADVETLLQSGNVLFSSDAPAAALETQLEKAIAKQFARNVDVLIRTGAEWKKILAKNPFAEEAKNDPSHLLILCLKSKPTAAALAALKAAIPGREYFRAGDRHLYLVYRDGIGTSKLTPALLDRTLGTKGTARNWNTAQKIAAKLNLEGQPPA